MPLQQTSGNLTTDAYGGGKAVVPNYIEDVFSTYLYTGNDYTQTITNGIDLAGKGGLVWIKQRGNPGTNYHNLVDTTRGTGKYVCSNLTDAQNNGGAFNLSAFNSNGFTVGSAGGAQGLVNQLAATYVSWTFRKQPKFFDVVTYTGTGSATTIAHNLGAVPGCVIVKCTSVDNGNWRVYHRGMASAAYTMQLNTTAAQSSQPSIWNSTAPTSTVFSVGTDISVNDTGQTYVAYIFAHNAGGFGASGTDNVISCGSYTGNGSASNPITLGYEPQWIIIKNASSLADWVTFDNMRGVATQQFNGAQELVPNALSQESTSSRMQFNATGFNPINNQTVQNAAGNTYIYIAIRRGPMKVPTDGTKVFAPSTVTEPTTVTTNFPVDLFFDASRSGGAANTGVIDRLRGGSQFLKTSTTGAESNGAGNSGFDSNTSFLSTYNYSLTTALWAFQRAPGFFDEVCYTGTGSATTFAHNLAVVPELIIVKKRSGGSYWSTYSAATTATNFLALNRTDAATADSTYWNNTTPTSTVFTVGTQDFTNGATQTFVAYLFATCAGVSKVGSYTGTGATQTISCGFTGGARFVLIKRTDSTGDWYVWDTARGMVSGTDPSLLLNSIGAEVNANSIYTTTGGFQIVSTAAGINASGGTYIFLAIA